MRLAKIAFTVLITILLLQACTLTLYNPPRVFNRLLLDKEPSVIHGCVTDGKEPVPGATVFLYLRKSHREKPLYGTTTNVDGEYTIKDVNPGINYFLVVESSPCYYQAERDPVTVQPGETYRIDIVLRSTGTTPTV